MFRQTEKKKSEKETSPKKVARNFRDKNNLKIDALISVIIDSFSSFFRNKPAQAAASIAYYTLFSIFPLILFMVVILSYFLETTVIQQEIILFLQEMLPGSEILVIENLQNILTNRVSTSLTASVTLLWSGSGAFNGIITNVQNAWPESRGRGYFINRAFAIFAIILLVLIVAILMGFSSVYNLNEILSYVNIEISDFIRVPLKITTSYILPILFLYAASFLLYYRIPPVFVDKQAAKISALVFALVWRFFTAIFAVYILSPLNRYDLVYGSVSTIIIILFYIYISSFIILYPAHLCVSITHFKQRKANMIESVSPIGDLNQKLSAEINASEGAVSAATESAEPLGKKYLVHKNARNVINNCIKSLFRWK